MGREFSIAPKNGKRRVGRSAAPIAVPAPSVQRVQSKLRIGAPNDRYEREADLVADQVMRMPEAGVAHRVDSGTVQPLRIQRICKGCEEENEVQRQSIEEEGELQAKEKPGQTPQVTSALESNVSRLKGGGRPLSTSERSFFEPRFGVDFSSVRIHNDTRAATAARSIAARAFTFGRNVAFGVGEYSPDAPSARKLLAHELTHVVQQNGGSLVPSSVGASPRAASGAPAVQRQHRLENDPATAPAMTCDAATSTPGGVSLDVTFGVNSGTLSPLDQAAVSNFVRNWHLAAVAEPVRVDGYASIDGPPSLNWPLSCRRAETLANELMTPSDGSPGIPASSIVFPLIAQGETDQFSSALSPNRRAQAHIPSVPLVPPTITSETVATSPGALTRTDIGVGEEVNLTHSAGSVTWATTAGTLSATTGATVTLTAPDTAQTVTVTAGGATKAFTVIAPTDVHMDRFPGTGIKHIVNRPNSGIETLPFLLPDTVNFLNVVYRELDIKGVPTTPGTYSCDPFSNGHCGKGGAGSCGDLSLTSTVVATKGTQAVLGDCVYSGSCPGTSAPFVPGSITVATPYEYKVGSGSFHSIGTVNQVHELAADASTLTTDKAGAHGETTVAAATGTIPQCP